MKNFNHNFLQKVMCESYTISTILSLIVTTRPTGLL